MTAFRVAAPVVQILSALIEEHAGLHYGPAERDLLVERLHGRASEQGFESLLDYYYFLRYDPAGPDELDRLTEHLVVHETYLFRELAQLEVVVKHFVAPRIREGQDVRVWSAACSTGEEPASLALLLAEQDLLGHVALVASDVSTRALEKAKQGTFGRRALRDITASPAAARRLMTNADGSVTLPRALLQTIDFRRCNLRDRAQVQAMGTFDVVLCRNVLIYFDDKTVAEVIDGLGKALRPGGALFVGVSESLLRYGTALTCEEHDRVFCYRAAS